MGYWHFNNPLEKGYTNMDLSQILNSVTPQESTSNAEKSALPQGTYSVKIEKVEGKTNATTGNKGISIQLRVFGSKFNNYCLFDYMAITGSENALKYSLPKLKKLGLLASSENTDKWLGKAVMVDVSVDKNDPSRNIVWGYSEYVIDDNTPINVKANGSTITADEIPF